ncbi:hypothetical protein C4J92_1788 [Pseudomonas sp. R3-18-08]|nr:hypothetical protein C4J92_1788 [Pseudomonas sp. R3-18-08]
MMPHRSPMPLTVQEIKVAPASMEAKVFAIAKPLSSWK